MSSRMVTHFRGAGASFEAAQLLVEVTAAGA